MTRAGLPTPATPSYCAAMTVGTMVKRFAHVRFLVDCLWVQLLFTLSVPRDIFRTPALIWGRFIDSGNQAGRTRSDIQAAGPKRCQSQIVLLLLGCKAGLILELASKKKQRKYREEAPDARAKKVEDERRKYALLLSDVIKRAKLPVAQLIDTLDDPASGWLHLFSARRANTLKNRFKAWKPFQTWLELHRGIAFPETCRDIINYMQCRVDDSCGKIQFLSHSVWCSTCWRR